MPRSWRGLVRCALFAISIVCAAAVCAAQDQAPNRRDVTVVARDHHFIPDTIAVVQDDLVRISLTSEGRPTSFAVDAYRILKRAGADKTIVFEFRADQVGTFPFYCSLTSDPLCKDMKGTLTVSPK
jgi:heme/copper-type cytochrome/quinol oxidase subunit 2